jgi:hypothetical protein
MTAPGFKSSRDNDDGFDVARLSSREIAAELNRRSLALRQPPASEGPDHDQPTDRLTANRSVAWAATTLADDPAEASVSARVARDTSLRDLRAGDQRAPELRVPPDSIRPAAVTSADLAKSPSATTASSTSVTPRRRGIGTAFVAGTLFGIALVALASAGALAVYFNPALLGKLHQVKALMAAVAPAPNGGDGSPPAVSINGTPAAPAALAPAAQAPVGNPTPQRTGDAQSGSVLPSNGQSGIAPTVAATPPATQPAVNASKLEQVATPANGNPGGATPNVAAPAIVEAPIAASSVAVSTTSPVPAPAAVPVPILKPAMTAKFQKPEVQKPKVQNPSPNASTTAPDVITPSAAWLQPQPYNPGKSAPAQPVPQPGNDWMQAQPFDPAKAPSP